MDKGSDPERSAGQSTRWGLSLPDGGRMAASLADLLLDAGQHAAGRRLRALAAAGIAADRPAGVAEPLSPLQFRRLLNGLGPRSGDELCGLSQRRLRPGSLRTLCSLLVQGGTLGGAVRAGAAFHHLLVDDVRLRLSRSAGEAVIRIADSIPDARRRAAMHVVTALGSYGLICWLAGRRIPLTGADFGSTGLPAGGQFTFAAQAVLRFGQPGTVLRFDAAWLDRPVQPAATDIPAVLEALPDLLVAGYRDRASMAERVLALLRRDPAGNAPLDAVAASLAVSPATLRRRLREEGSGGFMRLKDVVRQEAAFHALGSSTASLEDLARDLGFAELSTFHRAFKRWTGQSPGAFRAVHRPAAG